MVLRFWLALGVLSCCGLLAGQVIAQTPSAEIKNFKVTRVGQDVMAFADIKFELPSTVEEAMYKGVSLTFVSELEMSKERWYWWDKVVVIASRKTRISYQALTRRWRVLPWIDGAVATGLGVQQPQIYETLAEALEHAQRIYNWRITASRELSGGVYSMQLRYKLDISQLPKPLQIGLIGQGDWSIDTSVRQRFLLPEFGEP